MEKFDVSRSLFLSKKFESSKAVVHEQSFKIQNLEFKINSPASIPLSFRAEWNEAEKSQSTM